ncbi:RES family NAD+ phosphorylase [Burkholderia sp. PR2]|uniref:RES family NAD+ phosphorylase n=1 Tax=Burkholderia sp. PR2 TaxID=3448078 RepID=UPI00402AB188
MVVYRLCAAAWANRQLALNGEGAARYGQRWNPAGQRAAYFGSSRALCALEYLVHVGDVEDVPELRMVRLELRDDLGRYEDFSDEQRRRLPRNWRERDALSRCQQFGGELLGPTGKLGFKVPSALIPAEWNIVLNPDHPTFRDSVVSFRSEGPFVYDPRLLTIGQSR